MKNLSSRSYITAVLVCTLGVVGVVYYYFFSNLSHQESTPYIYIDKDDTVDSVLNKLSDVSSSYGLDALRILIRHSGYEEHVRTGRYAVEPGDCAFSLFRKLRNGSQEPIRLTIPEVRTMERLASVLGDKLMADSTSFINSFLDSGQCSLYGFTKETLPALFIPNTYEVYWDVSVENLMSRLKKEHDDFWDNERLAKANALGLTPDEVATLASIIDEETSNASEKPMVAGMYLNRLNEHMPLQADPTVKFALKDFAARRIYHKMLTFDSPYNTYKYEGLPPGPIKIASVKGIDAVLNRTEHDYLYMCAKEDFSGTHNFARTYSEHLANASRYTRALNERGIH